MTIQKKPVCLSLWNDKFAEFNLHQHFGLDPLASELPILTDKSSYKYLSEVAGNGKYIQVAWQKKNAEYLALYGTQSIKLPQIDNSVEFVDAEEV